MNEDTLWLQVPSAKIKPQHLLKVATTSDKLEQIALKLASLQGRKAPYLDKINLIIFVADNGIESEDEISFAQPITPEFLKMFSSASDISLFLANKLNTQLEVVNLGTKKNLESIDGIIQSTLATSTENFCHALAMNDEQLARAINIGRQTVQRIYLGEVQLFIASEINPCNALSALAITCSLLNITPEELIPHDDKKLTKLVHKALTLHNDKLSSALNILQCLGSFEIAALTGSYLCCAHIGIPVLIDGFASAVAALITSRLCPGAEQWFLYSQTSHNPAHKLILETLKAEPLLQFKPQMGNMAGITSTLSLLHLACASYNRKITFSTEPLFKRYS